MFGKNEFHERTYSAIYIYIYFFFYLLILSWFGNFHVVNIKKMQSFKF